MVNPNKKVKRPDGLGKIYKYKTDENENILTPITKQKQDKHETFDNSSCRDSHKHGDHGPAGFVGQGLGCIAGGERRR